MSETEKPQSETAAPEAVNVNDSPEVEQATSVDRIAGLTAERDALREQWLRAEAEMANLRNRTKREVEDAKLYALQKFATELVEVAENVRRGLESLPAPSTEESEVVTRLREGFSSIERNLLSVLERNGIRGEDPTGAMFDPNRHQAMAEQESAECPAGTVLKAWSNAWLLNGRLIKPAMVVVAKAASSSAEQETPAAT